MEDRLLKFVGLIDAGSYTKAAKIMHISQPALTMAVKQLEKELGKTLLVRHGRQFAPTSAGKEAYIAGRKIQASIEKLQSQISAPSSPKVFSLGMIDSIAKLLFGNLESAEKIMIYSDISIAVNNTDRLLADLQNNRLQYVIGTKSKSFDGQLIQSEEIASEKLVCICASSKLHQVNSELGKTGTIEDFISYNPESNTYALVKNRLGKMNIKAKITAHSTSPEVMKDLVVMGHGVAFLPQNSVQHLIARGMVGVVGSKDMIIYRPIWSYRSVFNEPPEIVGYLKKEIERQLS